MVINKKFALLLRTVACIQAGEVTSTRETAGTGELPPSVFLSQATHIS